MINTKNKSVTSKKTTVQYQNSRCFYQKPIFSTTFLFFAQTKKLCLWFRNTFMLSLCLLFPLLYSEFAIIYWVFQHKIFWQNLPNFHSQLLTSYKSFCWKWNRDHCSSNLEMDFCIKLYQIKEMVTNIFYEVIPSCYF